MNDLLERLPEQFGMVEIGLAAKDLLEGQAGPYIVVALQECGRMNVLLNEILTTLTDLDKGLKGQLNMTQAIEDLIAAFRINQWPGRNPFSKCTWQKYAWPSQKNLASQFIDLLARVEQLVSWSSDLVTPVSIWLPGLFNPSSYLTAVMQVTARATGVALDKMTTETHVTNCHDHNELTEYAVEGTYIHGFFIEGARWPKGEEAGEPFVVSGTSCAGSLTESLLKDLLPVMPVIYVKAVNIQPTWEPSAVGYLRGDPSVFECPVYTTTFRGPTYVFLATLKSDVPTEGWVTGAVALMMQSDD
jgi:dynein heavy chain